jgi:N-acetylneuraminic acid mutarotase
MFSLLSSWFRREVRSVGRGRRRPLAARRSVCKPSLEVLEDRNLLSSWTTVAPMPTARFGLAAATGADGRIYAIGGLYGSVLNTVEAYTPGLNLWSTRASMPTAREALAAAAAFDGRIYVFGGEGSLGTAVNTAEAYNPFSNTWSTVAPMPTARIGVTAATGRDGRIYAIGGLRFNINTNSQEILNTVEAYNPFSNTWSTVAPMPTPRSDPAAATGLDGRIYVFGGLDESFNISNTVEAYSPFSNTWSTVAPMPTARWELAAAAGPYGRINVLGGDGSSGTLNTVETYNAFTNHWSSAPPMPTDRYGLAAVATFDGGLYAIGGFSGSSGTYLNTVEVLQSVSGFGGAAWGVKSPTLASDAPTLSMVVATTATSPILEASDRWAVQLSGPSDNARVQHRSHAVFAVGAATLPAGSVDALFAGGLS